VEYANAYAHVLFWTTLLPTMAFYLQSQVLNTRRQPRVPLIATIIGTLTQIIFALYFMRGFEPEALNVTDLPLGNQSSYLGAAVARCAGSVIMVVIVGSYMILSRDQICPFGCLCCGKGTLSRWRTGFQNMTTSATTAATKATKSVATNIADEQPRDHDSHDDGNGRNDSRDSSHKPEPEPPKLEVHFWAWKGGFQMLLSLCGPSMLLMISEWWGFEALALMAGNLPAGDLCLNANGVLYNINVLQYQLYRGLGVGTSVYVGNFIGRKCKLRLTGVGRSDLEASSPMIRYVVRDEGDERSNSRLHDVLVQEQDVDDTADGRDDCDGNSGGSEDEDDDGGDDAAKLDEVLVQAAASDAKTFCWTGLMASIVLQLVLSTAYYFLREPLASIFTDDNDVIALSSNSTIAAAVAAVGYAMVMPANMVRHYAWSCLGSTRPCACARYVSVAVHDGARCCARAAGVFFVRTYAHLRRIYCLDSLRCAQYLQKPNGERGCVISGKPLRPQQHHHETPPPPRPPPKLHSAIMTSATTASRNATHACRCSLAFARFCLAACRCCKRSGSSWWAR
jgi:hypothetical protein